MQQSPAMLLSCSYHYTEGSLSHIPWSFTIIFAPQGEAAKRDQEVEETIEVCFLTCLTHKYFWTIIGNGAETRLWIGSIYPLHIAILNATTTCSVDQTLFLFLSLHWGKSVPYSLIMYHHNLCTTGWSSWVSSRTWRGLLLNIPYI